MMVMIASRVFGEAAQEAQSPSPSGVGSGAVMTSIPVAGVTTVQGASFTEVTNNNYEYIWFEAVKGICVLTPKVRCSMPIIQSMRQSCGTG